MESEKIKKTANNKVVIFMLEILIFVILIAGVFYGTYYIFTNNSSSSYENSVKKIITSINNVNSKMTFYNKGQALDAGKLETVRKELPSYIETLTKLKENLKSTVPTDKLKKDHENLINGLENNILMYRQEDAILKNPEGSDIDSAADDLKKYKDRCLNYYSKISSKNITITLSKGCINFIDNTLNYAYEMARIQRDKEISESQNLEFTASIDSILTKFKPMNTDFSKELSAARSDVNFDNIIALANRYKDDFGYIKQEFSNLSVPSNAVSCYNLLDKTFSDYEKYLDSFVYAVSNEKLSGSNLSGDKLKEIYDDPASKFEIVKKDYEDFSKTYANFSNPS